MSELLLTKKVDFNRLPKVFTCYKATTAKGLDHHTETIDYQSALLSGAYVYPNSKNNKTPPTVYAPPHHHDGQGCGHGIHVCLAPAATLRYVSATSSIIYRCRARKCDVVGCADDKIRLQRLDRVEELLSYRDVYGITEDEAIANLKSLSKRIEKSSLAAKLADNASDALVKKYARLVLKALPASQLPYVSRGYQRITAAPTNWFQYDLLDSSRIFHDVSPRVFATSFSNHQPLMNAADVVRTKINTVENGNRHWRLMRLLYDALESQRNYSLTAAPNPAKNLVDALLKAHARRIFIAGYDRVNKKLIVYAPNARRRHRR